MNHSFHTSVAAMLVAAACASQAPIEVHVLDADTGAVVPDATVYATGLANPMYQAPRDAFEPLLDRITRCGQPFRTDAKGVVVLPADLQPIELAVRHGDGFANMEVAWPPPMRLVLAMVPDAAIAVRVTDPDGAPSPVPVHAWRVHPDQGSAGMLAMRPDATGKATLRLGPLHAERAPSRPDGRIDEAIVALQLGVVAREAPRVEFALDEAPATIHLQAPACGSVEVTVLDDAGRPVTKGWAHLAPAGSSAKSRADHVELRAGKATFPAVAVGTRLVASASLGLRRSVQVEFDGPERAGASVSVTVRGTLPRGDGLGIVGLRGRIVDDGGRPVANTAVCVGVLRNDRMLDGVQPRTSTAADGSFACELLGMSTSGDEVVVATSSTPEPLFDRVALVRVETPASALDLGNLKPEPAPLLCDVRAVDAAGRPSVQALHVSSGDSVPLLPLPGSNLQADRHGRVRVHAVVAREQLLAVQTWIPGVGSTPQHCKSGHPHTITVPVTHPVPGRVQLAAARHAKSLSVRLVDAATYGQESCGFDRALTIPVPIAPDGTFVAGPAPAGRYHLQVLLGDAFELALVENLTVGATGLADAERLRRIDLGPLLREVTVTVARDELADDVVGNLQLAPNGEHTPGKVVRPCVTSWFRQRPLTLLVPTHGEWSLRAEIGGRLGPAVPVAGTQARVATR
ncbi:MAG: hypothetical protein JNK15_07375 [Planctomycetes bacterium]|nr:hypothetical protein [Planctomycetota bacterium]